jgi:hypothetical protein
MKGVASYSVNAHAVAQARRLIDAHLGTFRGIALVVYSTRPTMNRIEKIRRWLSREVEAEAEGTEPVATPPAGSFGEPERETSTNAQVQGARDEPYPGNH